MVSTSPGGAPAAKEEVPAEVGAYISTCIGCTQTDNHPKILVVGQGEADVRWHHDCYVIAKAPGWEDYAALIEGANGATGHALREHIWANTPIDGQEV